MVQTIPIPNIDEGIAVSFWSKVNVLRDNDCWLWTGPDADNGYGRASISGRLYGAHRIAYALKVGNIGKFLCVLHRCDNRKCCNPRHLFLGTQKDNFHDAKQKGKISNKYSNSQKRKLTKKNVGEIRVLCSMGDLTHREIAKMFGVCREQITKIKNFQQWR